MRVGVPALVAVAALHAAAGCKVERTAAGEGQERGACRLDRTCDVGLVCLSNVCVRPPAANCRDVAELLTSMDLGISAAAAARAPVSAKYQAACEAARVSRDEQQCLGNAGDRWRAAQCVPRMFPELAAGPPSCAAIVDKIRAATAQQSAYASSPQVKALLDRTVATMLESCDQDHWPDALKRCALAGAGAQALSDSCAREMPAGLQQRIQERLTRAMQDEVH